MQDDFPLTLQHVRRAHAHVQPRREVVTLTDRRVGGACAPPSPRSPTASTASRELSRALGIEQGDRVGTFAWNNQRHFELYFAVPCVGAVLHTLNIRLFAEQLIYIVNHAEDRVIFVDDSLVPAAREARPDAEGVEHYIVMGDDGRRESACPNALRYEELLDAADARSPFEYPELDERQAAALCYTSGTTGNPKGVLYSHRSISLHSTATLFVGRPRALARATACSPSCRCSTPTPGGSLRRRAGRRRPASARPLPRGRAAGRADRERAPDAGRLRADDLRRPAALRRRAPGGRPLLADERRLRRLGRAAPADEGLRGAPRRAHLPGAGG